MAYLGVWRPDIEIQAVFALGFILKLFGKLPAYTAVCSSIQPAIFQFVKRLGFHEAILRGVLGERDPTVGVDVGVYRGIILFERDGLPIDDPKIWNVNYRLLAGNIGYR